MPEQITLQKQRPVIVDGKLWKACGTIKLRDGTVYKIARVAHVDQWNIVIVVAGSDELVLVPKHSIDWAVLHKERFIKAGE